MNGNQELVILKKKQDGKTYRQSHQGKETKKIKGEVQN